jgi:hypothetical protein
MVILLIIGGAPDVLVPDGFVRLCGNPFENSSYMP